MLEFHSRSYKWEAFGGFTKESKCFRELIGRFQETSLGQLSFLSVISSEAQASRDRLFFLSPDFHELWHGNNDCLLQKLWHGHNDCLPFTEVRRQWATLVLG